MKKFLFVSVAVLFALSACKKECPKTEVPKCPKAKAPTCPKCKPCPTVPVAAKAHDKYKAPRGKRAEHLPITLPCINRSVLKFVDKKVIKADQAKKFSKLHKIMHDKGMEDLEKKIYGLQKKMAMAVAHDTWKEAEVKKQLQQMGKWQLQAYLLKANLVRDLHKILNKEQKAPYIKELERRINKIYNRVTEDHSH
ncbi:hypothetical protein KKF84_04620 [Myxococcota bacterium]|nr:hypothetical protein [Myxococcota bacterium]MBU1534580.1 hypothetical protein [Myxococcota bacterium]